MFRRGLFRLALLLIAGLAVSGCVSREALKEMHAQQQAKLEARLETARLPAVSLSAPQVAKLQTLTPGYQIVWTRAGRQADGKIFVCSVSSGKTLFGGKRARLITGTFDADGAFDRSAAYMWSIQAVIEDCRTRGFDPPVTVRTSYTVVRY